jgi:purine-binding chemotaxis protein CheW
MRVSRVTDAPALSRLKFPMHLCTFRVAGFAFGVDVARVREVIRYQECTRVPLASREVSGLMNLRGQILTTIDLRRRLDLPERGADDRPASVLVSAADGVVSLQVDQIDEVMEIDPSCVETAPASLPATVRGCLAGVCKLPGRLLLVLDERQAIQLTT